MIVGRHVKGFSIPLQEHRKFLEFTAPKELDFVVSRIHATVITLPSYPKG